MSERSGGTVAIVTGGDSAIARPYRSEHAFDDVRADRTHLPTESIPEKHT